MVRKSETLNLRVTLELKELVRVATEHESWSVSFLVEVLVRDYYRRRGLPDGFVTSSTW